MFYYDGIYTALRKTTFFVQLYSLPKSAMGHDGNDARGYVLTPDSEGRNMVCVLYHSLFRTALGAPGGRGGLSALLLYHP